MRNLGKLRGKITPVDHAPSLRRVNGFGCSLVGRYKDPEIAPLYFALYVFTAVWLPVMPLQIYIVSGDFAGYRFWAKISAREFASLYPNDGILRLAFSCLAESVLWIIAVLVALFLFAAVVTLIRGGHRCFWC
jgi:hypothetical protein